MRITPDSITEEIEEAASAWLSRRDRGLSAAEQDAYLEWLYRKPAHGRAIVQLERVWGTLNKLEQWRPVHSAVPNPDLLAPRRPGRFYRLATAVAAAAVIALALYWWPPARTATPVAHRQAIIHPGAERLTLEDGSIVELNTGATVDVRFTPAERHVRLLAGEAHFTVAHNAARPFFVDTDTVSVRAVGTAFSVSRGLQEIAVLVTEGKVQVISPGAGNTAAGTDPVLPSTLLLAAGQRTVIELATPANTLQVQEVTPAEIERALAWQALRLEFVDMPLADVAAEFNRYNRRKLIVTDPDTAAIVVGGNFRADNVDTFVRLLDSGFGITAFPHGEEIVLRKVR